MFFFGVGTDMGIDLGTATVLVYTKGKGIILKEPSVVAIDKSANKVLAVGEEARKMIGRTPGNIVAIRPLRDGVISDYDVTEKMLEHFIKKACGKIEEPLAAAIGAGLDITKASGNMVIDIGGGTTDIAVISLGGMVVRESIKVAGDDFDDAIIRYIRKKHKLMIGERTAEELKINIGCAYPKDEDIKAEIRGRDLITGLPKNITVCSSEMEEALKEAVTSIAECAHSVLEKTPPELAADIADKGIIMTGGGALLDGLDKLIEKVTNVPVYVAEDSVSCVAVGTGKMLDYVDKLDDSFTGYNVSINS